MQAVVEEAQKRLTPAIAESYAQIKTPTTWPVVVSYAPWLVEVWANYLSNALKYGGTPPEIELGFDECAPAGTGAGTYVRFWIRDNGRGLGPQDQARLFAEFSRIEQKRATGHGLGLSIVRRIIERLQGQVGVVSEDRQGSTFWFTLLY